MMILHPNVHACAYTMRVCHPQLLGKTNCTFPQIDPGALVQIIYRARRELVTNTGWQHFFGPNIHVHADKCAWNGKDV